MKQGTLIILSGPSGVGKGTVVKALRRRSDKLRLSVSATTRPPRPEDQEGITYFFKTEAAFREMLDRGEFLEYAVYNHNYYGTPAQAVDALLAQGFDVVLEIEPQGGLQVMERRPDAVSVFIVAPSFAELARRLHGRGDTSSSDMENRLQTARWEYTQAQHYQYIVVNDQVDACADRIMAILTAEKCRAKYNCELCKENNENALSPDV